MAYSLSPASLTWTPARSTAGEAIISRNISAIVDLHAKWGINPYLARAPAEYIVAKEGVVTGVRDFKGHNLPVQLHCGSGHFPPPSYVPVGHGRGFRREMWKQTRVKRRAATAYTLRINIFFLRSPKYILPEIRKKIKTFGRKKKTKGEAKFNQIYEDEQAQSPRRMKTSNRKKKKKYSWRRSPRPLTAPKEGREAWMPAGDYRARH